MMESHLFSPLFLSLLYQDTFLWLWVLIFEISGPMSSDHIILDLKGTKGRPDSANDLSTLSAIALRKAVTLGLSALMCFYTLKGLDSGQVCKAKAFL